MTLLSTDEANARHDAAQAALDKACEAVALTATAFDDLVAAQAAGGQIKDTEVAAAQAARDKALDHLERAEIACRATKLAVEKAIEAQRLAELDLQWNRVAALGQEYLIAVDDIEKAIVSLESKAGVLLALGQRIQDLSPRAQARPDVSDLNGSRLRARLTRAIELSMATLYPASSETRFQFPGFGPRMHEGLSFFVERDIGL